MKHRITPEIYQQITALAQSLPTMAHTDRNGNVLYHIKPEVKRYTGAEYIAEQRQRLENLKQEIKGNWFTRMRKRYKLWRDSRKPIMVQGKPIDPEGVYEHKWRSPRIVNHQAEMVAIYKTKGQEGIDEYAKSVKEKAGADGVNKNN